MKLSLTYDPVLTSTLTKTAQALTRNDLSSTIETVDDVMFGNPSSPRSFEVKSDGSGGAMVALTPFAELALMEIARIASKPSQSVTIKRKAILNTLTLAGFSASLKIAPTHFSSSVDRMATSCY